MSDHFFTYFLIVVMVHASVSNKNRNQLNGKHLRIVGMEYPISFYVKRNATGHAIHFDGVLTHHLEALSRMFNFSYSYLSNTAFTMEDTPLGRGGISYLTKDDCDYFLSTSFPSPLRNKYVDLPTNWYEGPAGFIIPYPKEKTDIQAPLKPFSLQVWIWIISSTLVMGIFLKISVTIEFRQDLSSLASNVRSGTVINFVIGCLISQSQNYNFSQLANSRFAIGVWGGGCFFLVQIYCSTLTSHLTYPNQKPIVSSARDLAHSPDVSFTVDRGIGLDSMFKGIETGDLKRLADKLNANPKFRCNATASCLELVRGGNAAYGGAKDPLKLIVGDDLKRTGTCHYYMMQDTLLSSAVFTALQKNSPYTKTMSIGISRIKQTGLLKKWETWFVPPYQRCMHINRDADIKPRLSMGHLSGAFTILIGGYLCALIVFIFEKITYCIVEGCDRNRVRAFSSI